MKRIVIFLIAAFAVSISYGERTKDKMYQQISVTIPCFRRLNATHQTGCSSKRGGSTGVVHYVENKDELLFILENGTAGPYIPVMPVTMLTHDVVFLLKHNAMISGLAVFKTNESAPDSFSHEATCPNANSALSNTCSNKWNAKGTGLLQADFPFPIFYLSSDEDVQNVHNCFNKFNNFSYETQKDRALCSLELNSFMLATTDTPTCIRRSNIVTNFNPVKFCDPIGDENAWSSLFPVANTTEIKLSNKMKYIIIAARLDSTSLFLDVVPGAVNPVTSIVTLLATAKLLKDMFKIEGYKGYDKNVLFVLFNGESYDYIGSQRFLYDMEQGQFPSYFKKDKDFPVKPIRPEDIHLFIELSQLGQTKGQNVHVFNYKDKPESREFLLRLSKTNPTFFKRETSGTIPPSSLQTFLRANESIPGLVFADHSDTYKNMYYNSIYDNASNIDYYNTSEPAENGIQKYLGNVSTYLAKAVYEEITSQNYPGQMMDPTDLINELLSCYLTTPNCNVFTAIQKRKFKDEPLSLYVSVSVTRNLITYFTGLTLGWFTGDMIQEEPCQAGMKSHAYQYFNMSIDLEHLNKTVCFRTVLNFTEAVSPAFIIKDYDWKSGQYSSWSESSWREIHARLFLRPSAAHENMTIAIGSLVLIFSIALVYFVKTRSNILFAPPVTVSPTSC